MRCEICDALLDALGACYRCNEPNAPEDWEDRLKAADHPPGRVKRLADMTPEEIAEIERTYGAKVKR